MNAAMCSKFVYLGSMLTSDTLAQGEIRRRAAIAWTVFGDLDRIWKSHTITWKLKGRLFSALVLSIMLYNAEVWPLGKDDNNLLEGIYTRMIKSLCTRATQMKTVSKQTKMLHTKNTDLLKLLGLPTMHGLLRQKRMRWVGHARGELTATSQRWR
jgi:acyl-coenzyme A synthetase/AMP-(fatty) acid ligase